MNKLLFLAGAAVLFTSAPALAKPKHEKAHKAHSQAAMDANRNGIPDYRERGYADLNGNGVLDYRERRLVDMNRNGVADWRERWIDMNRNGIDDRREGYRYSGNRHGQGGWCPPGLAKKTPACVPPGQAKRTFREGQRIPASYGYYTPYSSLSEYYTQYNLDDDYRYIRRDNYLYEVDPRTSLVRRVIELLIRR